MRRTGSFLAAVGVALLLRALVVAVPGTRLYAPWSGGSDTPAYLTLAQNLNEGKGYTYAGQPTAYRPPGYPLILATAMRLFPVRYMAAVRWLQFLLGLVTVVVCAGLAARLFGGVAGRAALLIGLFTPTLVYVTGEVHSETIAALITAAFLFGVVAQLERPGWHSAAGLGLLVGVGALFRFNSAGFAGVGLLAAARPGTGRAGVGRGLLLLALVALPLVPWVVRNVRVFDGKVLYSTQSGPNAAIALITPGGRTQFDGPAKIVDALGWTALHLETNRPEHRLSLPSESELQEHAWAVARQLWRENGWGMASLSLKKLSDFWLSTDQLLATQSFPPAQRALRAAGVLLHWLLLALAAAGGWALWHSKQTAVRLLIIYAVLLTLVHLPFIMITRYRVPLIDPLLVTLAGGGVVALAQARGRRARGSSALPALEPAPTFAGRSDGS
ncbi:MAG: glycosyltransferase family 39 protein [Gemmatimonadetes bacterium]|nr:glycosyltransferase family 39 protein [Gemmatimonadota bacterium]